MGKGPFKRFQRLTYIRPTKVARILGKCRMNGMFKRFQRNSMLNKSLNQYKFASTRFQHFCYTFNNVKRPVQTPSTFGSTKY